MHHLPKSLLLFTLTLLTASQVTAQDKAHLALKSPFASYVETDFPFFTQTVDARKFGSTPLRENLTPRGIIIPAGNGVFACFDPDLLRWAIIWKANDEGEYLSMDGMGTGSYRQPSRKSNSGQKELPRPFGTPLVALPTRPGISVGDTPSVKDPRDRGHAEQGELGLGPVPVSLGRFSGLHMTHGGLVLEYTVAGTVVKEQFLADGTGAVRVLEVDPHKQTLHFRTGPGEGDWLSSLPSDTGTRYRIAISPEGTVSSTVATTGIRPEACTKTTPLPRRWSEPVKTGPAIAPSKDGPWVYDDIPLPMPNPWKRNVRPCDIEFFPDGRAALLTFDGDVWIVEGLQSGSQETKWQRFASGLHEPQSLCIVKDIIHVFDRNGIIKLIDVDGNGEADWYANVSNAVAQSAETRNYPMDMIALPDGSFYLALGGQIGSTVGKYNGVVVKVTPDGNTFDVIATGFRQPYLGYDPQTGILTASDQQGNWKPATPIYRVEPGRYFGFQPEKYKDKVTHPKTISPAEVWIPHFINQSGASQLWVKQNDGSEPHMGALNGAIIHIGYNRPEIFKIFLDAEGTQGAVMPILSGFPTGLLNGRVNPKDGYLYLAGFQIFGSTGSRTSGLFRVRPGTVPAWMPKEIRAEKRGILLTFDAPLTPELISDLGRYSADRWNYHQTHNYGSGNFRTDNNQPGQDAIPVSSAKLSKDGKSLFLGIRDMHPSHSLRLTYRLPAAGVDRVENAYLTVHALPSMNLESLGFDSNEVDLSPRKDLAGDGPAIIPTADLGRDVALRYGCIACHSTGDPALPSVAAPATAAANGAKTEVGPSWMGLWAASRKFSDGSEIKSVDAAYLRESILDPSRRVQAGYEMERTGVGMPSYLGVLKDHEIDSVVMYIQTLQKKKVK
ncbi:DUF6797 domain-containing protein [Roseimicrobium sp. ORNL1]|uniref:DUF6797 domain-containing protein n=1 Tax=Roseimicrobium sp. ORNL1 TaxID=2711231 RepID=UPI0013E13824|nr:DUF6797 domain-containing protein [Roseimicrobium sp. ORNL1]QIF03607.1 hypothetical protein G5S37_19460 [Roseimicrobium sp. ORNL1]